MALGGLVGRTGGSRGGAERLARIHGRRARHPNWDFSGIPPWEGGLLEYFPIT